jgi:hypothetical protein
MLEYMYVYKYHSFSSPSSFSLSHYLAMRCLFKLMILLSAGVGGGGGGVYSTYWVANEDAQRLEHNRLWAKMISAKATVRAVPNLQEWSSQTLDQLFLGAGSTSSCIGMHTVWGVVGGH